MIRKRPGIRNGFTLVELMITSVIMVIVGLAIGVVIVDGQTGWNTMYERINSDVVTDGYVVRKKFDTVMRNASRNRFVLAGDGSWIEVYYYADASSTVVDRYARFYVADGNLKFEYGQLEPSEVIGTETLCGNVSECTFKQAGTSVQMTLTLDDGIRTNTIVTSAVTHNR
jgi:prepilin-type N-terminal cleavage/methylation domain-containing protein